MAPFFARKLRLLALAALAGALAGVSSSIFLHLLDLVTALRTQQRLLVLGLPLFGFVIGWAYHRFGGRSGAGHNLVLDEIHEPREALPARMAPFVLGGTVLTHLGGGSAGREGAAVQISAALADQLGRFSRLSPEERRALLVAGMGAGFAAAIGAPFAGVVFGFEVLRSGRLRPIAVAESVLAVAAALLVAHLARAPHTVYPRVPPFAFEWHLPLLAVLAGVLFGLVARAFVLAEHAVERAFAKLRYPPWRPLLGGALLAAAFFLEGSFRYAGLGIGTIQAALTFPAGGADPFGKFAATALTLGSGFKGGEFVPLVFIGATLGSWLAALAGLQVSLFAALGFAAVFGAAANTPLACALMAGELFGWAVLPYAWLACFAAYYVSGHPGVYRGQRAGGGKWAETAGWVRRR